MLKLGDHVSGHDKDGNVICGIVLSCTHSEPHETLVLVPEVDIISQVDTGLMYIIRHPIYGMLTARFRMAHAIGTALTLHTEENVL